MPSIISEMGKVVFRDMGRPEQFSLSIFRRKFWEEFERQKKLNKNDKAVRRRLFDEVMRRVKNLVRHPPKEKNEQLRLL